ncbi:MAG: hypothetical protein ACI89X_002473 [Planctomycetota bacterium]|jgi:hypothetical protein
MLRLVSTLVLLLPSLTAQAMWTALAPTTVPPHRTELQMQDVGPGLLMFAGLDGTTATAYNDLWAFDGTDWSLQLPTGASPPVRSRFAAAFDPARQRYIVFGGDAQYNGGGALGDTWEWDLATSTWLQLTPATQPTARVHSRMAYDIIHGNILMFGGRGAIGAETWSWDGVDWTMLTPSTVPPPREQANLAANWSTGEIIMFGGSTGAGGGVIGDTWVWNGFDWNQIATMTSPGLGGIRNGKMSHDRLRNRMVVFGGVRASGGFSASAWEFDGVDWTEQLPLPGPGGRAGPGFCYVESLTTNVLFGGYNGGFFSDTWTYQTNAPATSTSSGTGCASAVGNPILNVQPLPWLGETITWTTGNLPPTGIPLLIVGVSNPAINLAVLGAPNCMLYASPDVILLAASPTTLPIPVDLSLLGFEMHSQAVAIEPTPTGFDIALSDANTMTIGSR